MLALESLRANPALLKLDLYCQGMRLDDSCFIEEDGGRKILRTRAGLGSGLELILPGGLWTNVPVTEHFVARSPYTLHRAAPAARYFVRRNGDDVAPVTLSPRPAWYDQHTASGKPMTRIGTLQGTYLGIYQAKVCEYWTEKPDQGQLQVLLGGAQPRRRRRGREVGRRGDGGRARGARRSRASPTSTSTPATTRATPTSTSSSPTSRASSERLGLLVGVQTPPHRDLKRYDELREMGVNRVSFCFEIFDRQLFEEVCPGKHAEYGLDHYLEAIRYCAALGKKGPRDEPWVTNGEIIAGLEPPESSIRRHRLDHLGGRHPDRLRLPAAQGDRPRRLPSRRRPRTIVPVFRRLYEACMERGLPIGCAPNVHVSLVMLPEECRGLSDRRYPWQSLKLKALSKLVAWNLGRKMAAARAAAPVAVGERQPADAAAAARPAA